MPAIPLTPTSITSNRFPHVPASTAAAVREMSLRKHLLAEPREILLSPFGRIVLRCVDFGAPSNFRQDCEAWAVIRARGSERPGVLIVDGLAAQRLANTCLGLRAPRAARALGPTERGVVAATFAAVVRRLSDELTLSLDRPAPRGRDDLARITIALEVDRYREYVHLHIPPHWLPLQPQANLLAEAARRRLDLCLRVELARTELSLDEWSRAEVGDAIVFDGVPSLKSGQARTVNVACGNRYAGAELSPTGSLSIRSPFDEGNTTAGPRAAHAPLGLERNSMSTSNEDRSSRAHALLAAAPIEIVAEVGRVMLPAAEVLALGPGSILPLGWLRPESVELRVGERIWARGELVDVDGQLGVRLVNVADVPPPESRPPGDTQPIR